MISPAEFATLFDDYYPKLYAYVRSQVADGQTAEDLTAAAFDRAFSRRATFDPAKGTFGAWLFRIARNLVIDHFAASGRKPVHYDLAESYQVSATDPSPEQYLLSREQHQLLAEALATSLSERDLEIIYLRFYGRLTNREIARIMDLKEKTVSVIILRALQKLKTRVEVLESK
jgi:RNA polymerase sigma-70 factor (ECF subfamily)